MIGRALKLDTSLGLCMLEPVYAFVDGLMNVYGLDHVILYTVVAITRLYQSVCMPHNFIAE